ncbi:PMVK [Acanthosepion pharaonis]|uniref:Phosphomevalonate kinase n=1 Tax=Acanthosepion pharaonis TaxID=158019 RepID=A0A812B8X0_ACAPH|nr:PMVK [Sepia pharaonis]
MVHMAIPELVFVFSGKRKSGKDFVASLLQQNFTQSRCGIMRLSEPLKKQYALENKLAYEQLLDSSSYKEKFRADMIKWGEEKRDKEPDYFCRLATSFRLTSEANKPIWIISDARRPTDIEYFHRNYPNQVRTVRIIADESVRQQRGFHFVAGVDDAVSECGLDSFQHWDFIITNNGDANQLNSQIKAMIQSIPLTAKL